MYLILINLFLATSFNINHKFLSNRIIRNNYYGNNDDKLKKIDDALNNEKIRMKQLLIEKNKIMQNITGLDLHNETFIDDYLENVVNENIYDSFDEDGFNNEYDYEFKPRPNKINYNIIINTNPNLNSKQNPNQNQNKSTSRVQ